MTTRRVSLRAHHLLWPGAAVVIASSAAILAANPHTTYGGLGPWWLWTETAAAAGLVAAGAAAAGGGRRGVGAAVSATGVLWLLPEWAGWVGGPSWLRILAYAAGALLAATAVAAVASAARLPHRSRATVITTAVLGAATVATARVALIDPFLDPRCLRYCGHNPLVVPDLHGAGLTIERAGLALTLVAMAAVVLLIGRRLVIAGTRDTPSDPLSRLPLAGGTVLLAGLAVPAMIPLGTLSEPDLVAIEASFLAANIGAVVVALGLGLERARDWRLRLALTRLVEELRTAPAPDALEAALARILRDPRLQLLYWSETRGGYIDAAGRPAQPAGTAGTVVSTIVRSGYPVAAVVHSTGIEGGRFERLIGPAALLALENAQLRVAALAELTELRASRARIVEHADAERRRLERNLHDGAQQRVVGLALLMRMLSSRVDATDGSPAAAILARSTRLAWMLLDDLRTVAGGIHPASLADGGLAAAVPDLAESSTDLAVRIAALPTERYPPGVEVAAYLVVIDAIRDARRRAATTLTVTAHRRGATLVVDTVDDAPPGDDGHAAAGHEDRVGALDGRLIIAGSEESGTRVRLELPCGS